MFNYTAAELSEKYCSLGIQKGDTLFVTTGLGFLGKMKEADSLKQLCREHLKCLQESVGPLGTLVVPTYSYSFGNQEDVKTNIYNPKSTPSKIGDFPNYVINQEGFVRTIDPMMSVCMWGLNAENLAKELPRSSYGNDCIFERLLNIENTKCLSIGLGNNWTPFIHYFDYSIKAEYRFDKLFCGSIQSESTNTRSELVWNYAVPVHLNRGSGDCHKLGLIAELNDIWKSEDIGKSQIYCADYKEYFKFSKAYAENQVWPTTLNPKIDIFESEKKRYDALIEQWRHVDKKPEINTISHKKFNTIIGYSLSEVFNSISENIEGIVIDHIKLSTGSNIEKYVVPECIKTIGLNIALKDGKTIYSSQDEESILKYVLPSSCSFNGTLNDALSLDEHKFSDSFVDAVNHSCLGPEIFHIYNNLYKNRFYLTRHAKDLLNQIQAVENKSITIEYKSARFYSGIEAIILLPNRINSKSEVNLYCIDSLVLNKNNINKTLEEIEKSLALNTCVIICPSGYAIPIFKSNTNLKISNFTCMHEEKILSDHDNEFINSAITINPAINSSNLRINTLNFLIT